MTSVLDILKRYINHRRRTLVEKNHIQQGGYVIRHLTKGDELLVNQAISVLVYNTTPTTMTFSWPVVRF